MRKFIILCLVGVSSTALGISTKLSDVLNQGSQAIELSDNHKSDSHFAHSISVTGTISSPDGSIAENLTVKAFAGKMGSSQLMGSALTDGGGAYTIAFPSNDSLTIIVKVYCKSTLLATSAPQYNVTEGVSIDLTVPTLKCESRTSPLIKLRRPPPKAGS